MLPAVAKLVDWYRFIINVSSSAERIVVGKRGKKCNLIVPWKIINHAIYVCCVEHGYVVLLGFIMRNL